MASPSHSTPPDAPKDDATSTLRPHENMTTSLSDPPADPPVRSADVPAGRNPDGLSAFTTGAIDSREQQPQRIERASFVIHAPGAAGGSFHCECSAATATATANPPALGLAGGGVAAAEGWIEGRAGTPYGVSMWSTVERQKNPWISKPSSAKDVGASLSRSSTCVSAIGNGGSDSTADSDLSALLGEAAAGTSSTRFGTPLRPSAPALATSGYSADKDDIDGSSGFSSNRSIYYGSSPAGGSAYSFHSPNRGRQGGDADSGTGTGGAEGRLGGTERLPPLSPFHLFAGTQLSPIACNIITTGIAFTGGGPRKALPFPRDMELSDEEVEVEHGSELRCQLTFGGDQSVQSVKDKEIKVRGARDAHLARDETCCQSVAMEVNDSKESDNATRVKGRQGPQDVLHPGQTQGETRTSRLLPDGGRSCSPERSPRRRYYGCGDGNGNTDGCSGSSGSKAYDVSHGQDHGQEYPSVYRDLCERPLSGSTPLLPTTTLGSPGRVAYNSTGSYTQTAVDDYPQPRRNDAWDGQILSGTGDDAAGFRERLPPRTSGSDDPAWSRGPLVRMTHEDSEIDRTNSIERRSPEAVRLVSMHNINPAATERAFSDNYREGVPLHSPHADLRSTLEERYDPATDLWDGDSSESPAEEKQKGKLGPSPTAGAHETECMGKRKVNAGYTGGSAEGEGIDGEEHRRNEESNALARAVQRRRKQHHDEQLGDSLFFPEPGVLSRRPVSVPADAICPAVVDSRFRTLPAAPAAAAAGKAVAMSSAGAGSPHATSVTDGTVTPAASVVVDPTAGAAVPATPRYARCPPARGSVARGIAKMRMEDECDDGGCGSASGSDNPNLTAAMIRHVSPSSKTRRHHEQPRSRAVISPMRGVLVKDVAPGSSEPDRGRADKVGCSKLPSLSTLVGKQGGTPAMTLPMGDRVAATDALATASSHHVARRQNARRHPNIGNANDEGKRKEYTSVAAAAGSTPAAMSGVRTPAFVSPSSSALYTLTSSSRFERHGSGIRTAVVTPSTAVGSGTGVMTARPGVLPLAAAVAAAAVAAVAVPRHLVVPHRNHRPMQSLIASTHGDAYAKPKMEDDFEDEFDLGRYDYDVEGDADVVTERGMSAVTVSSTSGLRDEGCSEKFHQEERRLQVTEEAPTGAMFDSPADSRLDDRGFRSGMRDAIGSDNAEIHSTVGRSMPPKPSGRGQESTVHPSPPAAVVAETNHNPCTCKKCRCLKLYCDCFAGSRFCGASCLCNDCQNRPDEDDVQLARRTALERNPNAFNRTLTLVKAPESVLEGAGCGCTRSQCLKKYCVCFQRKVRCGSTCKCNDCMNTVRKKRGRGSASSNSMPPQMSKLAPKGRRMASTVIVKAETSSSPTRRDSRTGTGPGTIDRRKDVSKVGHRQDNRNDAARFHLRDQRQEQEDQQSSGVGLSPSPMSPTPLAALLLSPTSPDTPYTSSACAAGAHITSMAAPIAPAATAAVGLPRSGGRRGAKLFLTTGRASLSSTMGTRGGDQSEQKSGTVQPFRAEGRTGHTGEIGLQGTAAAAGRKRSNAKSTASGRGRGAARRHTMSGEALPKRRCEIILISPEADEVLTAFWGPVSASVKRKDAIRAMSYLDNDDIYNACLVNRGWSNLAMHSMLWEK